MGGRAGGWDGAWDGDGDGDGADVWAAAPRMSRAGEHR
ncbi:hypothetical protein L286_00925 [Sphingobium sp. HDIP04]|nr:hypothetical protein L286_00925 [Sphingobium sp. HDIP04]